MNGILTSAIRKMLMAKKIQEAVFGMKPVTSTIAKRRNDMCFVNREIFTADGREWWEPEPHECEETQEVDGIRYVRSRSWRQTGAISFEWNEWGSWEEVGPVDDSGIPF